MKRKKYCLLEYNDNSVYVAEEGIDNTSTLVRVISHGRGMMRWEPGLTIYPQEYFKTFKSYDLEEVIEMGMLQVL